MKVPAGYTEEQVLQIINKISCSLANKFKFGYHSTDDMRQQVALFAWQGLENYDGVRPLENFLWVHVRNRLYNFKRNNYGRPTSPCDYCKHTDNCTEETCPTYERWLQRNKVKQNLMSTKASDDTMSRDVSVEDRVFSHEIFILVEKNIPVTLREDWIRFTNKLKLPKNKREALIAFILQILKENGIEHESQTG